MMRRKEGADDYRYFPEPDLPPILVTQAYIDEIKKGLPELPLQRERRYVHDLGLAPDSAFILVSEKKLADYFEEALKTHMNAKVICNWIITEFAGRLKESGKSLLETGIVPSQVAKLVKMIDDKVITGRIAKSVADAMVAAPGTDPEAIVAANPDFQPVHDTGEIEILVDKVLAENPQSITDYKAGKDKAFAFLVGQVMKLSRGKASPEVVNQLLKSKM
jgi:aspartyl-tRNA(Asn)/glutamyl-tRNA(Gln) amidotransferase subunit B